MAEVSVAGREVVATGSVVLSPEDTTVLLKISDLQLKIIFEAGRTEKPEAIPELENATTLLLRLKHFDRPLGTFYWSQVGTLNNRAMHVAINVTAASPADKPARLFTYTISLGEAVGGQ